MTHERTKGRLSIGDFLVGHSCQISTRESSARVKLCVSPRCTAWVTALALTIMGCTGCARRQPDFPEVRDEQTLSPKEADDLAAWRDEQDRRRQRALERLDKRAGQRNSTPTMVVGVSLMAAGGAAAFAAMWAWGLAFAAGGHGESFQTFERDAQIALSFAGGTVALGVPLTIYGALPRPARVPSTPPTGQVQLRIGPGALQLTF